LTERAITRIVWALARLIDDGDIAETLRCCFILETHTEGEMVLEALVAASVQVSQIGRMVGISSCFAGREETPGLVLSGNWRDSQGRFQSG
jgi:hypothetical protein